MARRTRGTENEWVLLSENLEAPRPEEADALANEPSPITQAHLDAIEAARIRQDPRRLVQWLLKFEKKEIGRKLDPRTTKLCREARNLFVPGFSTPQPQDLAEVQRALKDGLNALRGEAPWAIELSVPKAVLWPPRRGRRTPKEGGARLVWTPVRRFTDRFIVAAMQALDAVGSMLRLCQTTGCPNLFLATTRQARCPKHAAEAQQALLAAWTEKRREIQRLQREAKARRRTRLRVAAR